MELWFYTTYGIRWHWVTVTQTLQSVPLKSNKKQAKIFFRVWPSFKFRGDFNRKLMEYIQDESFELNGISELSVLEESGGPFQKEIRHPTQGADFTHSPWCIFSTLWHKSVSQSLKRVKLCVFKGAEFTTLCNVPIFFSQISFCLKSHWLLLWIDLDPVFSPFLLWNKNGGLVLNRLILDL